MELKDFSKQIVFLGVDYSTPRGGIATVAKYYSQFFSPYKYVTTVKSKGMAGKLIDLAKALTQCTHYFIFDHDVKIAHIHCASGVSFWRKRLLASYARICGKKVVMHMHSGKFPDFAAKHKDAVKRTLSKADAVVTLTPGWRDYYQQEFNLQKVYVINNGINIPKGNSTPHTGLNFTFLGKLTEAKGVFDLLEVISEIQTEIRGKIRLTIGGNDQVERTKSMIKDSGIADIVDFVGWTDGEDKDRIMKATDVFVLPSYFEGLPVSVLEAMSYGQAIIATPVGGTPQIVKDNHNGFLITPGDKSALRNAILKFVSDPTLAKSMGALSKDMIDDYTPQAVSEQLIKLYQNLLQTK